MPGKRLRLVAKLENSAGSSADSLDCGTALAELVNRLPILTPLLDFEYVDPRHIARQVGMIHPLEDDGDADLDTIDFGPQSWFEPAAGLSCVRQALYDLKAHPESIASAVYDPAISASITIDALESLQTFLLAAQQRETRFHLLLKED